MYWELGYVGLFIFMSLSGVLFYLAWSEVLPPGPAFAGW
jgi:hypothetical protein